MDERLKFVLAPRVAATIAAASTALLLAGAHAFERIGKMMPCMLCLDQREAHWTALAAALITLGVHQVTGSRRATAAGLGVIALIYVFSAGLAAYHAGVEWKFWPGPATCSGGGETIASAADLMVQLETAPIVSCSDAAWRLFGISMAGYNALASLALAALTGGAAALMIRRFRREGFASLGTKA